MGAAEEVQREIETEQRNGAIIFLPSAIVPESYYRPVIERVRLNEDDIYNQQGKFRVRYEGLLKLSNAAGIEWSPVDSGRTDNGSDKLYVSYRAVGLIRKADGKLYPTANSYDLDLELIKEELEEQYRQKANGLKKSQQEKEDYIRFCVTRDWLHKRKHKATLAESGAKARVIRSILGLQSQYSDKGDILNRPFVMVRFVLDHQNPDIKQAMLSAARDNMSAVFGGGALPQPLPQFESAAGQGNIIDLPHSPEPDNEKDQSTDPDIPFDPGADGQVVDFENCDMDTRCRTIEDLCRKKKYDLAGYLSRAKCGLRDLSPAKLLEFFNYLNNL